MSTTVQVTSCCGDRRNWIDEPAEKRPGWIRTTCRVCRRFLGYRESDPLPRPPAKKRTTKKTR